MSYDYIVKTCLHADDSLLRLLSVAISGIQMM